MLRLSGKLLHKHWRGPDGPQGEEGGGRDHVFQANVVTGGLTRRLENHCPVESLHLWETHKKASWSVWATFAFFCNPKRLDLLRRILAWNMKIYRWLHVICSVSLKRKWGYFHQPRIKCCQSYQEFRYSFKRNEWVGLRNGDICFIWGLIALGFSEYSGPLLLIDCPPWLLLPSLSSSLSSSLA